MMQAGDIIDIDGQKHEVTYISERIMVVRKLTAEDA